MYEAYWNLDQKPFENTSDERFYYPSETHQGAVLKLRYSIEQRRSGALLAGASGTGKTMLVHLLRKQLIDDCQPFAHLVFPQMPSTELLAYLADELGATPSDGSCRPSRNIEQSVRRIQSFLSENAARGRHAVVVMDEAHLLEEPRTFEALRLLQNFEVDSQPAMTLLLCGQAGLIPILNRIPALEERLAVKCLLRAFTLDETMAYVEHRMNAAGAKRVIFEPESLEMLQGLAHGLPRRINRLCDLALLIGYAEERKSITAAQLETVCHELVAVDS